MSRWGRLLGFTGYPGSNHHDCRRARSVIDAVALRLTGRACLPQQFGGGENMMMNTSALEPAEYLRRLFDDAEFSYLVVVAAQLGVADLLAPGPQSIADLSEAAGVDAQSLYRVLRALERARVSERISDQPSEPVSRWPKGVIANVCSSKGPPSGVRSCGRMSW